MTTRASTVWIDSASEVFPRNPPTDKPNKGSINTNWLGYLAIRDASGGVTFPYFNHLSISKLVHGISLTKALSSLRYLIGHVVRLCSQEKVGGIHTGAVIAPMENKHAARDRADVSYVGNTVSLDRLPTKRHLPVAIRATPTPYPAAICFRHTTPKAGVLFRGQLDKGVCICKFCVSFIHIHVWMLLAEAVRLKRAASVLQFYHMPPVFQS